MDVYKVKYTRWEKQAKTLDTQAYHTEYDMQLERDGGLDQGM
jgi:hypothetical protein